MPLEPLPDHRRRRIAVGTSVRKSLPVLRAHLESLDWQEKHRLIDFHPLYVADFAERGTDAEDYLREWVRFRGGEILRGAPPAVGDFAEGPGLDSHQWAPSAMQRVGHNKNVIIRRALEIGADALWLVDSDLILDRTTFASLDSVQEPIVSAVYWTRWSKRETETMRVAAMPQVWLRHPYLLDGRGMEESEFRRRLIERELTRVWGFGACTLIDRRVLEAGVDFSYLPDVPREGMMAGEDRHFCIHAERRHIPAYADPWPDLFHIYHHEDHALVPEMVERLGHEHPRSAVVGHWVALRLHALEPLPVAPGRLQPIPPQLVRGRLGALPLAPELEEAVLGMERGEQRVVRVHFPLHHPQPFFRGRTRLIEVTLLDTKLPRPAPVLETEVHAGVLGGRVVDPHALTPAQQESFAEVANG